MNVNVFESPTEMGPAAAEKGAAAIRAAIEQQGQSNIILATGTSQFEMMSSLVQQPGIDWSKVTCFHLDEYVGIDNNHPASFCKYLRERFVESLPNKPADFYFVDGMADPEDTCAKLGSLIQDVAIDVAFIGIGENGHLAFNDPPADFETNEPYLVVELDEACRQQQFGEGWFESLEAVPKRAISMSVQQILKSRLIVCTVPDERKAAAVAQAIEGPVCNTLPASILQQHDATELYLDRAAASKLSG